MPPLLADFIHPRVCKPICEKSLTLPAIMVLEQGRIIERGDHAQLIQQKGQYYQLYTGAFELE